jgi:hypothetical protein
MKKILLLISIVTFGSSLVFAQEKEIFGSRMGIGFVPQYAISGGMRFDIDRSISKTSNQWLIVSPQVFMVTGGRFGHEFEELTGFGLDIKHKIYLKPNSMKPLGFYAQYGIMFQHFSIIENRQYTESYTENGIGYYEVVEGEVNTKLNKYGGNFHLGYQWLLGNKVYIDIYTGAGIRISHNNQIDGLDTWYNDYWVDYGYSGTLLDAGFRVGFYF